MRRITLIVLGIVLGMAVSSVSSVPGYVEEPEAKVVGEGNLTGWVITYDGEAVCWNLYVHPDDKQIECE